MRGEEWWRCEDCGRTVLVGLTGLYARDKKKGMRCGKKIIICKCMREKKRFVRKWMTWLEDDERMMKRV